MEKEKNEALKTKEINSNELDKIAGGNLVKLEYSYPTYGLSGGEEKKTPQDIIFLKIEIFT